MKVCSIDGCGKKVMGRGMCSMHYRRNRLGLPMGEPPKRRYDREGCLVDGCDRKHRSKGYCALHYDRHRRGNALEPVQYPKECTSPGCRDKSHRRGLCSLHYSRHIKGTKLRGPRRVKQRGRVCIRPGCDGTHAARGLCRFHYERLVDGRDIDAPKDRPKWTSCRSGSCDRPLSRKGFCIRHLTEWRAANGHPVCSEDGCPNVSRTSGLCGEHYAKRLAERRPRPRCRIDGCGRPIRSKRTMLCSAHQNREEKGQSMSTPIQPRGRNRWLNQHGYVMTKRGGKNILEHRLVMEQLLGRKLLRTENVHHVNGCRTDNRPENLELWSKVQPCGQRVPDKILFALEILMQYGNESGLSSGPISELTSEWFGLNKYECAA